jgi:serine/threonine protein kinase
MSLTGRTLGGRYCIQHRVGEGGTAHVYLARDIERDGEVAVKVLLPQLITDSALVERPRREAVIAMLVPDPDATGGLRAVVMDFGLAKILQEDPELQKLTRSGIVLGTPEFMSPEQLLGRELDGRSDLYATGVLAFEMFTGRLPFEGKNLQEVALARLKGEPLRLRSVQPDLPEELETVIGRALAQNPADRFQSMDELRGAFASVTAKGGVFGRVLG